MNRLRHLYNVYGAVLAAVPKFYAAYRAWVWAEFILQITNLPAQGRLRDMQFHRRSRDILGFSGGHEIAQMTQLHPALSIPFGYA